jgi:hypothetical protein
VGDERLSVRDRGERTIRADVERLPVEADDVEVRGRDERRCAGVLEGHVGRSGHQIRRHRRRAGEVLERDGLGVLMKGFRIKRSHIAH